MKTAKQWYAVYTKPGWEKKATELLCKKQIENYCPLNKAKGKYNDRKKVVYEPLFASLIFINVSETDHLMIKQTDGILNFIYWLGRPAVINNDEIEIIRSCLKEYEYIQLQKIDVDTTKVVSIHNTPLPRTDGGMTGAKSIKINLPSLGYALVAEIEKAHIEKIWPRTELLSGNSLPLFGYREAV